MNDDNFHWWASLKHSGLLIAPAKLKQFFDRDLPPLAPRIVERLRGDVTQYRNGAGNFGHLIGAVVEDVLDHDHRWWIKPSQSEKQWSVRLITGETWRPYRVCEAPNGLVLPLFAVKPEEIGRIGVGRGRRAVSRTVEWLRKADHKLALLTNGLQWRLIHAGSDYEAWCEWDIEQWFEHGRPSAQVAALRYLLDGDVLEDPGNPLLSAIQASRTGQAELSQELGERVRQAVELLIRACAPAVNRLRQAQPDITPKDLYIAANRVVMRCVIILFAEARELLPIENPIYHNSYGLNGLREQLDRQAGGQPQQRLGHRYGAWPRLLALFRLMYGGSAHERLPIPAYGGRLFAPGDAAAHDRVRRALPAFEDSRDGPHDAAVYRLLQLLTRSRVRVRQGRSSTWVDAPVDFSDLSSEYIGILYQGLLDFELRQAAEEPIVFLNLGDQPALPLARLEGMDDQALAALVEKLKAKSKPTIAGEDADEAADDDGADDEAAEEGGGDDDLPDDEGGDADEDAANDVPDGDEEDDDVVASVRAQAQAWAERAVVVGKLVNKPRGALTAQQREQFAAQVQAPARQLIARVVLPGDWFLVRWGGTRKGAGTFYTRPQLGVPLVRRTLEPLCYDTPTRSTALRPVAPAEEGAERQAERLVGSADFSRLAPAEAGTTNAIRAKHDDGDRRHEQLIPKPPEVILALKVCDSAMGSGSLLAAALRYLTEALFESLYYHGRIAAHGDGGIVRLADGQLTNDVLEEPLSVPPDHPDFDDRLRARLKRYVVERCIYGVDLDPLAVELAKLSLWIETMDRALPFGFLDHKLKCGNALVGCWLDRFQDYPVMAWEREGGDQNHDRFVHHFYEKTATRGKTQGQTERSGDRWSADIKRIKTDVVKPQMQEWIQQLGGQMQLFGEQALSADQLHGAALATFEQLHALPVHDSAERARRYQALLDDPAWRQLKRAFDTWCAVWFWPGDALDAAPLPLNWAHPSPQTAAIVDRVSAEQRFFHWELEFPDVFNPQRAGFDAMIKNPPWDILKPKSQEFFSNIDPLYRTYTKQDALRRQTAYFEADARVERDWLQYNANFRAMSNWSKYAAWPFGDADGAAFSFARGKENARLHRLWAEHRRRRTGYADRTHPFRQQGSADLNAYKMFLELCYVLARESGWLGLIVPSGLSSDKGTGDLRDLFLDRSRWEWLFGFENKNGIFDIHRSFKFYATIMQKGGRTDALRAAFMRHDVGDWADAERHVLAYPRRRIQQFSPQTQAILEIRSAQDLRVLEKLYGNSVLLGDTSENGWGIKYATEFHMTNDSKLFPPRPKWEQKGYRADEYGHWIKGQWRPAPSDTHILARERGTILSADGQWVIGVGDSADVALPLYQGVMVQQFDFSAKRWLSGTGLRAKWEVDAWDGKRLSPQFLMSNKHMEEKSKARQMLKPSVRRVARNTDQRTVICTLVSGLPCGDKAAIFAPNSHYLTMLFPAFVNSYVFDWAARIRVAGTQVDYHIMAELPLVQPDDQSVFDAIALNVLRLNCASSLFAQDWAEFLESEKHQAVSPHNTVWQRLWAVTDHERLRLRCILDAVAAHLYGLDIDDFAWILRQCDYPTAQASDNRFTRALDVKGFWRVDKDKDPELRHTVLSLVAFHDLQANGLDAFLSQNDGDGWQLPATLRLADYGLGHDGRAQQHQPVASRLGPRFLPWQLEGTPEQSWAECERHAENLRLLLGDLVAEDSAPPTVNEPATPYQTNLLGEPVQTDLFGDVVQQTGKRKRGKL